MVNFMLCLFYHNKKKGKFFPYKSNNTNYKKYRKCRKFILKERNIHIVPYFKEKN